MRTLPSRPYAVLAALALGSCLLAGCGDDPEPRTDPTPTEQTSEPTPIETATEEPGDTVAAPVYFVGETPQGPRLYREFRQVEADNPLEEAGALVTAGDTLDPDYRTAWPQGAFASVTQAPESIVVELADDGWLTAGDLDAATAELAVQQLVLTLQGTAGEPLPVEVVLGDGPVATLLGIDATKGFTAAPELDVLALVNITEPAEGATVSGTFTATGRASSFEATVPWEVRDESGTVVLDGFATAEGWMDKLYPWTSEVDVSTLEPGSYTFVARTDDPSDGEGGGPTEDTKRITVK
ncbi:Gmad2 immunoglobulin-like domain-containing protein [Nocardioides humi]|uniref:GerMN domain-containing protein n=1 Tax=Nocardioides humi TaxID=449461 RepID=A0ABN2BNF6_9ACTN|nr:Gmad2 immunoglobulin-like domain-containing protein [Nocardioides humi]